MKSQEQSKSEEAADKTEAGASPPEAGVSNAEAVVSNMEGDGSNPEATLLPSTSPAADIGNNLTVTELEAAPA